MEDGSRIIAGPTADRSPGTGPLSMGTWILEHVQHPDPVPDDDAWPEGLPELRLLHGGDVEIYDGCNWMRGTYMLEEDTLTFARAWTSTMRACEPTRSWEALWRALRSPGLTWTLTSEDRLVLDPGVESDRRLTFRRSH